VPADGSVLRFQTPTVPAQAEIDRYFERSREAGWYSNFGPCVHALEQRLSDELLSGMPVVSASNATVALMVAMRAVFGGADPDRNGVLVPSFTFVGSLSAITWAGFRPVFVDIDPDDWQTSGESLGDALSARRPGSRAIAGALLTTTFGSPLVDDRRAAVEALLVEAGVPVVVDSAAGLGSCPPSALPGSATVYSLHATKPFAIGEGGVVATADPALARRVRELTNFGFDDAHGLGSAIGINAKLPEILAATGLAVLDRYADTLAGRRARARGLVERLLAVGLTPQRGSSESTFQFVPVLCPTGGDRDRLLAAADAAGVQVRTYFDPPMHRVPAFGSDEVAGSLAVTEDVSSRIVALPMSNDQTTADADLLVEVCTSVLR
jgi:dTDP-4-amino-4,6-dideoxygalactose transaminase